jgi:formate hydrogenlyase transcriptional activator
MHNIALVTSEPVLFNYQTLELMNQPHIQFILKAGIREVACVRLKNKNEIIGSLVLLAEHDDAFLPAHLNLLARLSHHFATAVSNIIANERIEAQLVEINRYKQQLEDEKHYLQEEAKAGYSQNNMIGSGPEMQRVFNMLSQVSSTNSTVLLMGETGTGKELIARSIHDSSRRSNKLMVKVNCAALPPNLVESELFGHERGSFTGATERRMGKFELANHGTLFLDEVGEMPLEMQVKLLRAIQEREFERVGGRDTIKVDVRLIAATNRDLQKEVHEGRFRSDLFYRLNVFPIVLPPLREHKEDIPALARFFLNKYAKNVGRRVNQITREAMDELMAYAWPGNVRELEHVIERSIIMTTGNVLSEMHLPRITNLHQNTNSESQVIRTFEENERSHIIEVLNRCKGKIFGPGGAAKILDLKVGTLNSKIKKLGITKLDLNY